MAALLRMHHILVHSALSDILWIPFTERIGCLPVPGQRVFWGAIQGKNTSSSESYEPIADFIGFLPSRHSLHFMHIIIVGL